MSEIHRSGYWLHKPGEYKDDGGLAQALERLQPMPSLLDLGCGNAFYLRHLAIPNSLGLDGNPHTQEVSFGRAVVADLGKPLRLPMFDTVMSIEVAEHLPVELEETYLENITRHAQRRLILSWAVPGQAGHGHVNCRPPEYVAAQLQQRGFVEHAEEGRMLREAAKFPWLRQNVRVYYRQDRD